MKAGWLILYIFLTTQPVFSQKTSRVISGLVTTKEEGNSLPGVLVYVRGTKNFSGTQQDGVYYIEVTGKDSVLVFRYDDYRTEEVRLLQSDSYNVVLERKQDDNTLSYLDPGCFKIFCRGYVLLFE